MLAFFLTCTSRFTDHNYKQLLKSPYNDQGNVITTSSYTRDSCDWLEWDVGIIIWKFQLRTCRHHVIYCHLLQREMHWIICLWQDFNGSFWLSWAAECYRLLVSSWNSLGFGCLSFCSKIILIMIQFLEF